MTAIAIATALRGVGSAKVLARLAGVAPKTAGRWQRGETQPDAATMVAMMGQSPKLLNAVLRAAGLSDILMDIEEARMVAALAEHRAKRLRDPLHDQTPHTSPLGAADGRTA